LWKNYIGVLACVLFLGGDLSVTVVTAANFNTVAMDESKVSAID
jgi:hypothetical protein